jgi:hypothetical protein
MDYKYVITDWEKHAGYETVHLVIGLLWMIEPHKLKRIST